MSRIRECDDVWERSPIVTVVWALVTHLELASDCLQSIYEVCFIGSSKGSSLQVDWNFSTGGGDTE